MRGWLIVALIVLVTVLGACSDGEKLISLADVSLLPAFLDGAHHETRDAYRYAISNPEELDKYPCYCGCNSIGHLSNKDCYVRDINKEDGTIIFDEHGAGCGTCVAITMDVMRMKRKGMASPEIRQIIDAKYVKFGPPTDTPLPLE